MTMPQRNEPERFVQHAYARVLEQWLDATLAAVQYFPFGDLMRLGKDSVIAGAHESGAGIALHFLEKEKLILTWGTPGLEEGLVLVAPDEHRAAVFSSDSKGFFADSLPEWTPAIGGRISRVETSLTPVDFSEDLRPWAVRFDLDSGFSFSFCLGEIDEGTVKLTPDSTVVIFDSVLARNIFLPGSASSAWGPEPDPRLRE